MGPCSAGHVMLSALKESCLVKPFTNVLFDIYFHVSNLFALKKGIPFQNKSIAVESLCLFFSSDAFVTVSVLNLVVTVGVS